MEGQRKLLDERALHVLGELRDPAVERQARLDADREQIERVGKLLLDPFATAPVSGHHEQVGEQEAGQPESGRKQDAACVGGGDRDETAEEDTGGREQRLACEE